MRHIYFSAKKENSPNGKTYHANLMLIMPLFQAAAVIFPISRILVHLYL